MTWQRFSNLGVPRSRASVVKRRYSVTADVISFQRCARQYGYFAARGYEPAHTVQIYYGTIIHQVLDRAHVHYRGLVDPAKRGQIPTDQDIEDYFNEVDRSLRARRISSLRLAERDAALSRLKLFNAIEGPTLYPRVRDTEHRLQSDRGSYLLHGTVDVLADDPHWLPTMGAEIWDYKGGHRPKRNSQPYHQYEFQMLVYAELYRERNGLYPLRSILYFLGELDGAASSLTRPADAIIEVVLDPRRITVALQEFDQTVVDIERCKAIDTWPAPQPGQQPEKQTCDICDLRWHCPTVRQSYPIRYP